MENAYPLTYCVSELSVGLVIPFLCHPYVKCPTCPASYPDPSDGLNSTNLHLCESVRKGAKECVQRHERMFTSSPTRD